MPTPSETDPSRAAHRAAMRDTFLRLMPVVAEELDDEVSSDAILRRTDEVINALVSAYLEFSDDDCDVEKARRLCALLDRFAGRLDDDPRWIGGVLDPVLVDARWAQGREPRPERAVLSSIAHQTHLRARALAAGETRPIVACHALDSGDAAGAASELWGYLAEFPGDLRAWACLARARAALGDSEGEIEAYRRVIGLGDLPLAHYALGLALWREKQLEEALGEFRVTRSSTPEFAEAWHNEGLIMRAVGSSGEARERFTRARAAYEARLDDQPEDAVNLMWLAGVIAALDDKDLAAKILAKALALCPSLADEAVGDPDLAGLLPSTHADA